MKQLAYLLLLAFGIMATLNSCKPPSPVQKGTAPEGAIVLWPNVHVVDSTQWVLANGNGQPGNGDYIYDFTSHASNINVNVGDIIIGATNGGYIRKVTSVSLANNRLNLFTTQATMADVFKSGTFSFQVPITDAANPFGQSIIRSYSNINLSDDPNFNVDMVYGQFNIQPIVCLTFSFDSTGLANFQMSTNNTRSIDTFSIFVHGTEARAWNSPNTLANFPVSTTQWINAWGNISVPVVMKFNLSFNSTASGSLSNNSNSVNVKAYWNSNSVFTAGLQYSAGQWQSIHSGVANNTVQFDINAMIGTSTIWVTSTDQITSQFYTVPGPDITVGFNGLISQAKQSAGFDQGTASTSFITVAQNGNPVFGRHIGTHIGTWSFDSIYFQTPYRLTLVSGNNQDGNIIETLPNPLIVKVTDSYGGPVRNVKVNFSIVGTSGGGQGYLGGGGTSLNIYTDQNGNAQTTWVLGQQFGTQQVKATVLSGNNLPINGAPVTFSAAAQ